MRSAPEDGSVIAEYYYNPFGRRLWKDVNGVRTYYAYADEGLIGEDDAAGVETRVYGWRPDSMWMTDPLFQRVGTSYYWYQNDALGTPGRLVDVSGTVVWSALYGAFGRAQVGVAVVTNNLRLPGQYFDAETGLHYNWHRYYDPATGRYLAVDPLGDGLNPYLYARANPLLFIDPEGTHGLRVIGGVLEIVSGVAMTIGSGGLGTAGGILLIANGLDNLIAGSRSLADQENRQALLEQAVYQLVPQEYAPWVYAGTQIAIPYGALKLGQMDQVRQLTAQGLATGSGDDAVDAYRAVSKAEADDIAEHGFRADPSGRSLEDKWFSESREGAEWFRGKMSDLDEVVHTRVPRSVYDRSFKHANIDGTGPGFCVQCNDFPLLPKPR